MRSDGGVDPLQELELSPPLGAPSADVNSDEVVRRLLRAAREHLGVDVAFIGEVTEGQRVFRHVDSRPGVNVIATGGSDALEDSYCGLVLDGRLPQYMRDPSSEPAAAALEVTAALPVGTHLSVPIRFSDGRTYGTFCCFSLKVDDRIAVTDLRALELMADLAGDYLEAVDTAQEEHRGMRRVVRAITGDPHALTVAYQPLCRLDTGKVVGYEALARFRDHPDGPAPVFATATKVGLSVELEMHAVRAALAGFDLIPAPLRMSVNVSPDTLYSDAFIDAVCAAPTDRVVVEVTEHTAIDDYTELKAASARLHEMGIALAIDDVGMGFSGLNRILESSPDELKLDASVIRGIDADPVKQALVDTFSQFGARAGFTIVAEGIETAAELRTVRELGVSLGQGYYLGRPGPLSQAASP